MRRGASLDVFFCQGTHGEIGADAVGNDFHGRTALTGGVEKSRKFLPGFPGRLRGVIKTDHPAAAEKGTVMGGFFRTAALAMDI